MSYTLWSPHRQAVDAFLHIMWPELPVSATVLEIGAGRTRGEFDIPTGPRRIRMDLRGETDYNASVAALPHRDATFDAVLAVEMLYLVDDVDLALAECRRVLRPGGWFIATTPALHPQMEKEDWLRLHRTDWIHVMHKAFGDCRGNVFALGGPWSGVCQILHRNGWRGVRGFARTMAPFARGLDRGREERWPLAWGLVTQTREGKQ